MSSSDNRFLGPIFLMLWAMAWGVILGLVGLSVAEPATASETDGFQDGSPMTIRILDFTFNGFDIGIFEPWNESAWGPPTDRTKKALVGPICAFLRDDYSGRIRFKRREGPSGIVFFDVPILLRSPGVPEKVAEELRQAKGWDIDARHVLWVDLTAIRVEPEYANLFGDGVRAEVTRLGNINTRPVHVVTFSVRVSAADAFERALVEGHNFVFSYEARVANPRVCQIQIQAKDIRDLGFDRDLRGEGGARYVTRSQAVEMLRQLNQRLNIKVIVDLEVPERILTPFIEKAFSSLKEHFWKEREIPLQEFSMKELSGFMVNVSGRDFTADLLKHLAEEFASKDAHELLQKYKEDLKYAIKTRHEESSSKKSNGSAGFLGLFNASGGHETAKKNLGEYAREDDLLLETMKQIKDEVERSFRFEKEGEFYVAKDIIVYDVQNSSLSDDRVLSEEVIVDRRGFRADPYIRNTGWDLWSEDSMDLIEFSPELRWLFEGR